VVMVRRAVRETSVAVAKQHVEEGGSGPGVSSRRREVQLAVGVQVAGGEGAHRVEPERKVSVRRDRAVSLTEQDADRVQTVVHREVELVVFVEVADGQKATPAAGGRG